MSRRAPFHPPSVCPVCGEDVPPRARACPECGADEQTGWKPSASADRNRPRAARESGGRARKSARQWIWWVVALVLLIALTLQLIS